MTEDFEPGHDFPENDLPPVRPRHFDAEAEEIIDSVLNGDPFAPIRRRTPEPDDNYDDEPDYVPQPEQDDDEPFSRPEQYEEPEPPKGTPWTVKLPVTLLILAVVGFAVFCIVWDMQKGTAGGGYYRAGDIVQVDLIQAHRTETDVVLTDANGKYTVEGIAATVMPSIVQIYKYTNKKLVGTGSGFILSDKGYIATNAHVVTGGDSFSVQLYDDSDDGTAYDAILIGHDTKTDLAVLKISADGLKAAVLGDSDEVHLGEQVCALGNPAGFTSSISLGIISGMNRKIRADSTNFVMDCFQTDAAISPGNSGGALVDMEGHVIGITTSKFGSSSLFDSGKYEGLGFAIKINEALPILTELMEKGYVSGRVRIGIQFLSNANAQAKAKEEEQKFPTELVGVGILVMSITEDSDLNRTALQPGDYIITVEGRQVTDYDDVNDALEGKIGGDYVHCRCARIDETGKVKYFEIDFRLLEDQSGDF
ncbi:MAG: trypsin-like peptidase domain-containing protein [Oscillospiraceae bacterium]|nr:trypsin-like peptidase domain-containing protein [Oscillospiraceae bacterium]